MPIRLRMTYVALYKGVHSHMTKRLPDSIFLMRLHSLHPLREALRRGQCDVNAQGEYGETALHVMAYERSHDPKLVQRYIDNGADVQIKDKLGNTPLDLARAYGNDDIAQVLERAHKAPSRSHGARER